MTTTTPSVPTTPSEGPALPSRSTEARWPAPVIGLLATTAALTACLARPRRPVLARLAVAGAAITWIYGLALRPWHLRWGATDDEVRRAMPGDDEVPRPLIDATRAVTIAAPPAAVWPLLVQLGHGRAGFYTYAWIENLGGMDIHNVDHIVPAWQHLQVGDLVRTSAEAGFTVTALEPDRCLVMVVRNPDMHVSVAITLEPLALWHTRLVGRLRVGSRLTGLWPLYFLLFDPGDFIMMRQMLLTIKMCAERAWLTAAVPSRSMAGSEPAGEPGWAPTPAAAASPDSRGAD